MPHKRKKVKLSKYRQPNYNNRSAGQGGLLSFHLYTCHQTGHPTLAGRLISKLYEDVILLGGNNIGGHRRQWHRRVHLTHPGGKLNKSNSDNCNCRHFVIFQTVYLKSNDALVFSCRRYFQITNGKTQVLNLYIIQMTRPDVRTRPNVWGAFTVTSSGGDSELATQLLLW